MITYSIIRKSEIESASRIDAEYYQPEYLERIVKLKSISLVRLGDIAYITDGEHGSPIFDSDSGIKYFSAQHIRDCFIDDFTASTISKTIDEKNKRSRLQEGDVLLSTVGTIGFAGIVTKKFLPANIDRHVARIVLKKGSLQPEFLVAFLNSLYGKLQSIRESTGNVQLNLFIDKIKELLVPRDNNPEIAQLVKNALYELEKSKILYDQAEYILLEELGLKEFKPEDALSYIVNLSDIKTAHRADAEYFQPKYEKLISSLGKRREYLNTVAERKKSKTKIIIDVDYKYVEISDVDVGSGEVIFNIIKGENLPENAKLKIDGGELIVSKVRPTRGAVSVIPDEWNESFVASGAFSVFEVSSPLREYLQVVLRSIVGKLQLEKPTTGTSYPTITDEDVEKLLIPILPKPTQEKIADLVRKSHEARKKAKELLEEAKQKVEKIISGEM